MDTMTHTHSPITPEQLTALTAPLNKARVSEKQRMSYLEAWDVKATLIRMFGFGGFSAETMDARILRSEQVPQVSNANKMNWEVTAQAVVRLTIHQTGAVYQEYAIAGSKQPDFTESADMAIKSAESDALKRAAIYLGTQFGLSLYNNGALADVVSTILAPGQEMRRGVIKPPVVEQMQQIIDGGHPDAAASVAHVRPNGVTEEQHQANQDLLNRAMSARAAKDAEPADVAGEEYQQHVAVERNAPEPDEVLPDTQAIVDAVNR